MSFQWWRNVCDWAGLAQMPERSLPALNLSQSLILLFCQGAASVASALGRWRSPVVLEEGACDCLAGVGERLGLAPARDQRQLRPTLAVLAEAPLGA